ncbi:hypothetical protein [Bacillus sp. AFS096315]|uniref:hypothetical protein n=1 Tax=Bacillus sp. AFS096315 TaxID=2033517 RepID=UPI000BEE5838|nr:hypothetical protein [Bacillus sp. AFS096315]PEC46367.1 hypothetical protein CON00_23895 [Bacillus sp. AFS096315]
MIKTTEEVTPLKNLTKFMQQNCENPDFGLILTEDFIYSQPHIALPFFLFPIMEKYSEVDFIKKRINYLMDEFSCLVNYVLVDGEPLDAQLQESFRLLKYKLNLLILDLKIYEFLSEESEKENVLLELEKSTLKRLLNAKKKYNEAMKEKKTLKKGSRFLRKNRIAKVKSVRFY